MLCQRLLLVALTVSLLAGCPQQTPNLGIHPDVARLQGMFMGNARSDLLDSADEVAESLYAFHNRDVGFRWERFYNKYAFLLRRFKDAKQDVNPDEVWDLLMAFEADAALIRSAIEAQRASIEVQVAKLKANAGDWDAFALALARQRETEVNLERENAERYKEVLADFATSIATAQLAQQAQRERIQDEANVGTESPEHHPTPPDPPVVSNPGAVADSEVVAKLRAIRP